MCSPCIVFEKLIGGCCLADSVCAPGNRASAACSFGDGNAGAGLAGPGFQDGIAASQGMARVPGTGVDFRGAWFAAVFGRPLARSSVRRCVHDAGGGCRTARRLRDRCEASGGRVAGPSAALAAIPDGGPRGTEHRGATRIVGGTSCASHTLAARVGRDGSGGRMEGERSGAPRFSVLRRCGGS